MTQAKYHLDQYYQAKSLSERQQVAAQYNKFYNQLNPDEQKQADDVMGVLWPSIRQKVDELDSLTAKAKALLNCEFVYQNE